MCRAVQHLSWPIPSLQCLTQTCSSAQDHPALPQRSQEGICSAWGLQMPSWIKLWGRAGSLFLSISKGAPAGALHGSVFKPEHPWWVCVCKTGLTWLFLPHILFFTWALAILARLLCSDIFLQQARFRVMMEWGCAGNVRQEQRLKFYFLYQFTSSYDPIHS